MSLSEFNAWLEGYSASFKDGTPDADQWEAIKAKLATVTPIVVGPHDPFRTVFGTPGHTTGDPIPYWQQPVIAC